MTNITDRIKYNCEIIDKAISEYLEESVCSAEVISEAMRYSTSSGGKRIRPALTLEFCRLFGGNDGCAVPFAVAVELIHSYSLIHDDLPCMDNDDVRRGKPSCHVAYGEANALLAGDALLTRAFEICAENKNVSAETAVSAVSLLAKCAGAFGMVGGQVIDLYGDTHKLEFETLLRLHSMKTGALICAAVGLGCLSAGVDPDGDRFADARLYAKNIGLTFQIIDDILDAKDGNEDENKTTFLTFMSEPDAYEYAKKLTDEAIDAISKYENSETLVELAAFLLNREK